MNVDGFTFLDSEDVQFQLLTENVFSYFLPVASAFTVHSGYMVCHMYDKAACMGYRLYISNFPCLLVLKHGRVANIWNKIT